MYKYFKSKFIISCGEKVFEDSVLVVKDGKVFDVIKEDNFYENTEIIDFGNVVITAGFINLHAHLQYTDLKPVFKEGQKNKSVDFVGWIIDLMQQYSCWPKEKKVQSFKNALRESVLSGCTCIAQLSREEIFVDILNGLDIKSFVFLETFSDSEENSKKEIEKLKKIIKEKSTKNITLGISPHSIYNCHKSLWQEIAKFSVEKNVLVHTHLAESQDEIDWLNGKSSGIDKIHKFVGWNELKPYETGLTPVEYLEKLQVLSILKENLTAAHCIELDERNLEKLVNYGVKIAHCPRSNVFLHGKTLNLNNISKNILKNIGIGTDSKFSNYDLNLLNEIHGINLSFEEKINMLTINAARILKIDGKTGSLEKDKDADFLVFKLGKNEDYKEILNKKYPEEVFVKGKSIAKNGELSCNF